MVAAVFRIIFAQPAAETVAATWDEVRDQLAKPFPKIGPLTDEAKAEVIAFTGLPRAHWSKTSVVPAWRILSRVCCASGVPIRTAIGIGLSGGREHERDPPDRHTQHSRRHGHD
jgi:hypothetical protein